MNHKAEYLEYVLFQPESYKKQANLIYLSYYFRIFSWLNYFNKLDKREFFF